MSLFKLSAVDIVKLLKEGKYTCEEVIKSFIEQIDKNEKKVEAWEFFDKELALNQAKNWMKITYEAEFMAIFMAFLLA